MFAFTCVTVIRFSPAGCINIDAMVVGMHPEPINGRELSTYEYSEAGVISGLFTRAIIQPLDVLKIRFQVCLLLSFVHVVGLLYTTC